MSTKYSDFAIVAATIVVFATIFWLTAGATEADKVWLNHFGPRIQSLQPVW